MDGRRVLADFVEHPHRQPDAVERPDGPLDVPRGADARVAHEQHAGRALGAGDLADVVEVARAEDDPDAASRG